MMQAKRKQGGVRVDEETIIKQEEKKPETDKHGNIIETWKNMFLDTILYQNDKDYKVVKFYFEDEESGIVQYKTVVGNYMLKPEENIRYTLKVKETQSPKYGKGWGLISMDSDMNLEDSEEDQKSFLSAILTSRQVESLYTVIEKPFDAIKEKDVGTLCEASGIGLHTANKIIDKYAEYAMYEKAIVTLKPYGVTMNMIMRLMKHFNDSVDNVIHVFEHDIYKLIGLEGFGWTTIDDLALKVLSLDYDDPQRVKAYIMHILNYELNDKGNSYVDNHHLASSLKEFIGGEEFLNLDVKGIMQELYEQGMILYTPDKLKITTALAYNTESKIMNHIRRIKKGWCEAFDKSLVADEKYLDGLIDRLQEENGLVYAQEQRDSIKVGVRNNIVSIAGLAGTGKTTVVKAIVKIMTIIAEEKGNGLSVSQCALAGRAATVLQTVTGYPASTIHSLLQWGQDGEKAFKINAENPLPTDVIIVDESSMIGGLLFLALFEAIQSNTKVILIGDIGQLDSIGEFEVFKDLVNHTIVPSVFLTQIHRQAQKSAIITEAKKVRYGEHIISSGKDTEFTEIRGELQDLTLDITKEALPVPDKILEYYIKGFDITQDIMEVQAIGMQRQKGVCSVYALNELIQEWYNPAKEAKDKGNWVPLGFEQYLYEIRVGDKVINRKNTGKMVDEKGERVSVMNGHIGIVVNIRDRDEFTFAGNKEFKEVSKTKAIIEVYYPVLNKTVLMTGTEQLNQLFLGYTITCHSFQGSQAKQIICAVDNGSYTMLSREMLYTMMTRASEHCVIVGENSAIRRCVDYSSGKDRKTWLKLLCQAEEGERLVVESGLKKKHFGVDTVNLA